MANLRKHGSGPYHLEFRFAGRKFQRSLRTGRKTEATRLLAVVEQTLEYLQRGVLSIPAKSSADDLWTFVISGGKKTLQPEPQLAVTKSLSKVCEEYLSSYAIGSKEDSTLKTEGLHLRNLQRVIGKQAQVANIAPETMQAYVTKRQKEEGIRGRGISATTILKELGTFSLLWKFAVSRGWACGENPATNVRKPRASEKPPFMTYEEITRRVSRGGLSDAEVADLWDALFLRESEVGEVLTAIKKSSEQSEFVSYLYPATAFCAYTGARRSEMFRTLIDDVDSRVVIREKKRSQRRSVTFRELPLHPELQTILQEWQSSHPGGQHLFCKRSGKPLEDRTARHAFKMALRNSKWKVLRGFHVFRHSFASNLARHGTDQRIIDSWMGHQTEEMQQRYRHLFPEDTAKAMNGLSYGRKNVGTL